jgi:hypothetical protein
MSETIVPSPRIHRVTTRRQHLRALACPLEPELLVAEFAGELPPEVAQAVREHIAVCETCGGRSQALRAPYELLSSLGNEPVPYVPDLRDTVQAHVHSYHWAKELARRTAQLGRGGTIVLISVLGLAVMVVVLAGAILYPALAGVTSRSQNGLAHVPAAAPDGVLYAETNKLIPVTDKSGTTWQVAEVIAVNQRDGAVARSMPDSGGTLHVASQGQQPAAVAVRGDVIAEVTAPDTTGQQALVAFDASSGQVRSITPLAVAGQQKLAPDHTATALALSPDGALAYVGLNMKNPATDARVLAVDTRSGDILHAFLPAFTTYIPMPPPPGGLPASAFPQVIPHIDALGMQPTLGLNGALAISPDGAWLFDVLTIKDANGQQYAVVRRFDATNGVLAQELALPSQFTLAQFAANTNLEQPQIYLVTGTPDAEAYVLDGSTEGPLLEGEIPLGGPVLPSNAQFSGTLSVSASADGTHLLVTQDGHDPVSDTDGHDLWMLDTSGMVVNAHRSTSGTAGALLANTAASLDAKPFALQNGQVNLFDTAALTSTGAWLNLKDGQPILQLLGTTGG